MGVAYEKELAKKDAAQLEAEKGLEAKPKAD